jgi:large subunit ribosomal protein L29
MRAADLREKSEEDLKELQRSLLRDVFQNRLKNFTNRLDDTSSIHKAKRDLARVTTLLREVELGIVRAPKPTDGSAAEAAPSKAASAAPEAEAKPKKSTAKKAAAAGKTAKKPAKKDEAKKS